MSYAIGAIVYGFDLTEFFENYELDYSNFEFGYAYSGNGPTPVWIGKEITTIDECSNFSVTNLYKECKEKYTGKDVIKLIDKNIELVDEYLNDELFEEDIDDLKSLKNILLSFKEKEPDIICVWGSS